MCLMDEGEFVDIYDEEESDEAQDALTQAEEDNFFAFQLAKICDDYGCSLLDPEQLKVYFELSAKDGNVLAMYALYKFYIEDNKYSEAKDTLIKAAERQYPRAMIKIGELYENGQVATQYVNEAGQPTMDEEWNVNGSYMAIEGITSPDGRVLGKMAHSERRGDSVAINIYGEQDMKLFESGVAYFK